MKDTEKPFIHHSVLMVTSVEENLSFGRNTLGKLLTVLLLLGSRADAEFLSTSGVILPCAGLGVELDDPCESLLTQDIF